VSRKKLKVYSKPLIKTDMISFGHVARYFKQVLEEIPEVELVSNKKKCDLQIWIGLVAPQYRKLYRKYGKLFVFYTVCETTEVPPDYIDRINKRNYLWVPSEFCREIFRQCGVTLPIRVIHHGIDEEKFQPIERSEDRPYTFLWQGVNPRFDRKGGDLVIKAFKKLNLKDARLIVKGTPLKSPVTDIKDGNIHIFYRWLDWQEMRQLDTESDCFVWPTRGEAFGLIPLEKMATAMPCIVTNWSGCCDYLTDATSFKLNYTLQPALYNETMPEYGYWGKDAKPDFDHLCHLMEWCYNHREEAAHVGVNAAFHVRKFWTWDKQNVKQEIH
jgi:hypothetical protein